MKILFVEKSFSNIALVFILIVIFLANPLLLRCVSDYENGYSLLFLLNFMIGLLVIWRFSNSKINLLLLFYLTSSLFIGGRFFSSIFGIENSIWTPTFFYNYFVSNERKLDLMSYVLLYFNGISIGLLTFNLFPKKIKSVYLYPSTQKFINNSLKVLFIPIAIYIIWKKISQLILATQMGYAAIYLNTNQNGGGADLLYTVFLFLFGISMAYGDKRVRSLYISLFVMASLIMIIVGGRGMFGSVLLVLLWMYCQNHNITIKKIIVLLSVVCIVLLGISKFSIRNQDLPANIGLIETLQLFLFDQGSSLMVFDTSRLLNDYPWQPYFQNFIPGFVRISEFISGQSAGTNASFAAHMCSTINPSLYANGNGLGWTLMSDIYLYSMGNKFLFFLITILLSYGISILAFNINNNKIIKLSAYTFATSLLILPRSGLNSSIPLLYYSLGGWILVVGFAQLHKYYLKRFLNFK